MSNIKEFINYSRDVIDTISGSKPSWVKYVLNFQRMYDEKPESFVKVFQHFLDTYRKDLEKPIFVQTVVNHDWIKIKTDEISSKGYRGVVLFLSQDNEKLSKYCIPISEIYTVCLKNYASSTNVKNVHYELVPITFLSKMFKCLLDVEPDNKYLSHNFTKSSDVITAFYNTESVESVGEQNPFLEIMNNATKLMSGDPSGMDGIRNFMEKLGINQNILELASQVPNMINTVKTKVESGEKVSDAVFSMPEVEKILKEDNVKNFIEFAKETISNLPIEPKITTQTPLMQLTEGDASQQE